MPIIEVTDLTKEYTIGQFKSLKSTLLNAFDRLRGRGGDRQKPFKALDSISFQVEPGEVLGIIGENGAGKSTLLKMLARISKPTRGEIHVRGAVAPLIEVGAGLVADLTGRENVFLNGAILGLSRADVKQKFDEIVAFAELEQFIDTPIKRYSSGMSIRLAFAIATSVNADILIVDEVLAVGDLAFQRKCFDRMEELIKRQGKTVLLVSHNIRQVERLCSRTLLMHAGKILADDAPAEVCELFYDRSNRKITDQTRRTHTSGRNIRKSGEVELESIQLIDSHGKDTDALLFRNPLTIRCVFNSQVTLHKPEIIYGFHTTDFYYISSMGTAHIEERPDIAPGTNIVECHITSLPLVPGVYCLRISLLDMFRREVYYGEMLKLFSVHSAQEKTSKMPILGIIDIPSDWLFKNALTSDHQ
jgi:lipopolysaccharide transport system ATP-binding protein